MFLYKSVEANTSASFVRNSYIIIAYFLEYYQCVHETSYLEVDGYPSKENLFLLAALLMNAMYIVFP